MFGFVGHMSGGKTYSAVADMLQRLLDGHIVVSNIRLNCKGVTSYLDIPCCAWKQNFYYLTETPVGYHEISLLDYENYPMGVPRGEPGYQDNLVYIYFDEASSVFDSITHSSNSKIQEVATWARHTEKRGQILFLIMQFSTELHKRLRNHITEYVSCVNTSGLRIPFLQCHLPFFLRGYIIQTRFAGDEETQLGGSSWVHIEPAIYDCYYTGQIVIGNQIGRRVDRIAFDYGVHRNKQISKCIVILILVTVLNFVVCFILLSFFA